MIQRQIKIGPIPLPILVGGGGYKIIEFLWNSHNPPHLGLLSYVCVREEF